MITQRDIDKLAKQDMAHAAHVLAAAGPAHKAQPAPVPVKHVEKKRRVLTEGDSGDESGFVTGVFYD